MPALHGGAQSRLCSPKYPVSIRLVRNIDPEEFLKWKCSFLMEDGRTLVSDKVIAIDQRYLLTDPLPADGNTRQYRRIKIAWSKPVRKSFLFDDLREMKSGNYAGPDYIAFNRTYIDFFLQRIPRELLRFGMTGGYADVVHVFREDEQLGLLMPFLEAPPLEPKLIDEAESGNMDAQFMMARHYHTDTGEATKDYSEAVKWYQKAAQQNHPAAHFYLSNFFFAGFGVERDPIKTVLYCERAIELGYHGAVEWRGKLLDLMTPEGYRAVETLGNLGSDKISA